MRAETLKRAQHAAAAVAVPVSSMFQPRNVLMGAGMAGSREGCHVWW